MVYIPTDAEIDELLRKAGTNPRTLARIVLVTHHDEREYFDRWASLRDQVSNLASAR